MNGITGMVGMTGTELADLLHELVWGPWTLILFLGTGIWFTVRCRFFQIIGIRRWWQATGGAILSGNLKSEADSPQHTVTPFQSACTALAATIGTGNIVGVATALTCGGPGALFWMWISAAIGMMTAYAETFLGQVYRYRKADGHWMCGPMVYMERGLGCRPLAVIYTVLAVLSSLGMGSMVQSNSVSTTLQYSLGWPRWACGLVVTVLTAAIILGGIHRISQVAERLMPVSAGVYLFFSLIVITSCARELPGVMASVFYGAFHPRAAFGGAAGFLFSSGVRYGLSRGVFSNEAGLGTLAVLHGAAEQTTPEQQGMWAMFEVWFDTIVICTLTALVILCVSSAWGLPLSMEGAALTAWCFSKRLGAVGELLVSIALMVFAFATIIAWYYMGRQTAEYLAEKTGHAAVADCYPALYLSAVFLGCICRLDVVWLISDLWNGLMAYPNLLAIILLARQVKAPGR